MTTEQHKFLYNIGMSMTHGNSSHLHLCPNKRDYEYFTYWSNMPETDDAKYGAAAGRNEIQMNRRTGEEIVLLEKPAPSCSRLTQRVPMVSEILTGNLDNERIMEELDKVLAESIWKVAIEKTLVLKVNCGEWEMPMVDFVDAFDPRALLSHFRSLFQCLLAEANSSGNRVCIMNRMTELFQNLETIYYAKEEVLKQVKSYMQFTQMGIEKAVLLSSDLRYSESKVAKEIDRKSSAKGFLLFLFSDVAARERFQKCITVLKAFLEAYMAPDAGNLLVYLQRYALFGVQINSIDNMLRKIDLGSSKAKTANIRQIERYLENPAHFGKELLIKSIA